MSEPTASASRLSCSRVRCPRCQGTGQTALDPALADCLAALKKGTPATSLEIHERMATRGYRSGHTATMNRLAKLCRLGLAIRRGKSGKWFLYRLPHESRPLA